MRLLSVIILVIFVFEFSSCTSSKTFIEKKEVSKENQITIPDTINTGKYGKKIAPKAVIDTGLFNVHKVGDRYFFEIADTLIDRDLLVINRIVKAASIYRNPKVESILGYAGDLIGEYIIRFDKGPGTKLYIKQISYRERARSNDSSQNGLYYSVLNSNVQPIVAAFDIIASSGTTTSYLIDVTDFVNKDNALLTFASKNTFEIGALHADKSYVSRISAFANNIEIRMVRTYGLAETYKTYELNSSIRMLPKEPMRSRLADGRIGYFTTGFKDFDAKPYEASRSNYITRWRLEPKEEDIDDYKSGKLVEPRKPIIFYIDPTTPKKWISYLIAGVNDWQKAFEKAGFKNAIYALEAPKNDREWSLEDANHSALVYKPSEIRNAFGSQVNDPRSGEILESHISWHHNILQLLRDWYVVQAGAVDPRARSLAFNDSLMGQLVRYVCAHEVGHAIGLTHNFGASSTIPVEKLRDKKWVEENGFCPSIMDYARFNYVAQPEDSIASTGIMARIGPYDEWAIEWGYRWFPEFDNRLKEKLFYNKWVIERMRDDKRLWYGSQNAINDPRCQSESLGDDAIKASIYGIRNLKRIMTSLQDWAIEPAEDYEAMRRNYELLVSQYKRYLFHVADYIGGMMFTVKTVEQDGPFREFVSRDQQKAAIKFLNEYAFNIPDWFVKMDNKIFMLSGGSGFYTIKTLQQEVIQKILSYGTFTRLLWFENTNPTNSFSIEELLKDMKTNVWSELKSKQPANFNRRNLQKEYVAQLINLLDVKSDALYGASNSTTDALSIVKGHCKKLLSELYIALKSNSDELTRLHFVDLRERLSSALNGDTRALPPIDKTGGE